jgi:hypothetical protein
MSDAERRIGNDEREAAVAALQVHRAAGRLDSGEYEERSLQARQARTWDDLNLLFTDLPDPGPLPDHGTPPGTRPQPGAAPVPAAARPDSAAVRPEPDRGGGLLPDPWGAWLVSLSPFVALILFFATGNTWQWFLIVPIAGLIGYGPYGHRRDRRDRRGR